MRAACLAVVVDVLLGAVAELSAGVLTPIAMYTDQLHASTE